MNKLIIVFGGLFLILSISIGSAQAQSNSPKEIKGMLTLEYVVKELMIKPIDAKIIDRYIAENKGREAIVIKCDRSGLYSDDYIKEKLHEFTQMKGDFGPESGFGANTDILRPWQK